MEINWYGHSCFRLSERGMASVVCDPYDHRQVGFEALKLKADIVTVSIDLPGHNYLSGVKGDPFIVSGPGEYEVGGVFITGAQTNGHVKRSEDEPRNTLYVIDYNGITVAHLGDLNRVPTQAEVEALGPLNIALVPVGGGGGLNASKAAEVISLLEPSIVIPMHYETPGSNIKLDPLAKFLKEMGLTEIETSPSLKVTSPNSLPEETHVVVLDSSRS
ncbi:MAG: MBL fold metallo-hydrolase [Chloroflexi bacterium]|nr:MBL fold metallo-hydrolase [Anaerolineaceae bacterium]NMB91006.1 MBL fold metallo-hydrolase [Chloroflexota bacterium]